MERARCERLRAEERRHEIDRDRRRRRWSGAGHETRADLLPDTAVGWPGEPGALAADRARRRHRAQVPVRSARSRLRVRACDEASTPPLVPPMKPRPDPPSAGRRRPPRPSARRDRRATPPRSANRSRAGSGIVDLEPVARAHVRAVPREQHVVEAVGVDGDTRGAKRTRPTTPPDGLDPLERVLVAHPRRARSRAGRARRRGSACRMRSRSASTRPAIASSSVAPQMNICSLAASSVSASCRIAAHRPADPQARQAVRLRHRRHADRARRERRRHRQRRRRG